MDSSLSEGMKKTMNTRDSQRAGYKGADERSSEIALALIPIYIISSEDYREYQSYLLFLLSTHCIHSSLL